MRGATRRRGGARCAARPTEATARRAAAVRRALRSDDLRVLDEPSPKVAGRVGLHRPQKASPHAREERRGGYALYIPESWDGTSPLPLVVALHGAGPDATGPTFLWELRRAACTRGFALLSPSSLGYTWGAPPPKFALPAPGARSPMPTVRIGLARPRGLRPLADRSRAHPVSRLLRWRQLWTQLVPAGRRFTSLHGRRGLGAILRAAVQPARPDTARLPAPRQPRQHLPHPALAAGSGTRARQVRRLALDVRHVEARAPASSEGEAARMLAWWDPSLALPGRRSHRSAADPKPPPS